MYLPVTLNTNLFKGMRQRNHKDLSKPHRVPLVGLFGAAGTVFGSGPLGFKVYKGRFRAYRVSGVAV